MKFNSRQWLILAAVVVLVAAGAIWYATGKKDAGVLEGDAASATTAPTATSAALMQPGPLGDMTLGDPKAPNVVIEYASMTCTHCQRFHAEVYRPFKAKYIDTGKVYFIFRDFPLDPLASAAIVIAHCAPKERFFPLVDLMFDHQDQWAFVQDPAAALLNLVKQAGFTQATFDACLTNQKLLDGVNSVHDRAASEFGVNSTPTFFVNGQKLAGEQTLESLDKLLGG